VQSGYVSIEKVACGSCEDKVSLGDVNSCCSAAAGPSGDLCCIEQKCCKSEKSDYQVYRISQSLKKLTIDDLSIVYGFIATQWNFEFTLNPFTSWNIHGPPLIKESGRALLISICKYSL